MYKRKDNARNSEDLHREFCALVLVVLSPSAYRDPMRTTDNLAKYKEVEAVDMVAGKWDLVLKVRTEDQHEFYGFLKKIISEQNGILKTNSLISLKRIKPIPSSA